MSTAKTEETIGKRISDTHSMRVRRLFPSHLQLGSFVEPGRNVHIADYIPQTTSSKRLRCYGTLG